MMNLTRKITHLLLLVFLVLPLFSCDKGCVGAEEFDSESIIIKSKPAQIYGTYDPLTGGQRVDWQYDGLRSNGSPFLMQIYGAWAPLQGGSMKSEADLDVLPRCNMCATKNGVDNCICYLGQTPAPEKDPSGRAYTKAADGVTNLDCAGNPSHQDDVVRCTCTTQHGLATDYGVSHFPLNLFEKDGITYKLADEQTNCKLDRGLGAYVALWGGRGVTTPIRSYHLFSEESVCNINRDSNGNCIDSNGRDVTNYVFRSANNRIFMKDDHDGNDGIDLNTGNDEYHGPNEHLKAIMYDTYYSDNYGEYNVQIIGGVGNESSKGILEFLVSLVENVLLGEIGADGKRDGGIIRFMYLSIVQDSGFIQVTQLSLIFYITLFGAAHLWGLVEMDKKEVTNRMLKIALVVFFVSPQSWYFYNSIIVNFFKDGMDYVVGIFMSLADSNIDQTSMIKVSQMDRVADASSATRFSYVDLIIRKLMSEATAKKIAGLVFDSIFGIIYVVAIYFLIGYFIYSMLLVARLYLMNLMKLVFVLSIGPIFMVFTLFSKTASFFRNWIGYVAGRSFEMIILFIVLYLFVSLIDKNFTEMLYYKVCGETWGIKQAPIIILKTHGLNRSLAQWLLYFAAISGLIWVTNDLIDRLPNLVAALFSLKIGGEAAPSGTQAKNYSATDGMKAFSRANDLIAQGLSTAASYTTTPILRSGIAGVSSALSSTFGGAIRAAGLDTPSNLLARNTMGQALNAAMKAGDGNEQKIRAAFMENMRAQLGAQPMKMAGLNINEKTMAAFLDKKLVAEPLKGFIAQAAKDMRSLPTDKIPIGDEANKYIKDRALELAAKSMLPGSVDKATAMLEESGMKGALRDAASLTANEAGKLFAGNKEMEDKFRAHLADNRFKQAQKDKAAIEGIFKTPLTGGASALARAASNLYHATPFTNTPNHNPSRMQSSFERALDRQKNQSSWYKENPFKRSDFLDKHVLRRSEIARMTDDAKRSTLRDKLQGGAYKDEEGGRKAKKENDRRDFFRDQLEKLARDEARATPRDLMSKERDELLANFEKKDGRTLFEKATKLSELNKRLGIGGKDAQLALADMIKNQAKRAAHETKSGRKGAEERMDKLRDGMYGTELDKKIADQLRAQQQQAKKEERDKLTDKERLDKIREAEEAAKKALDSAEAFRTDKEKAKEQLEQAEKQNKKIDELHDTTVEAAGKTKDGKELEQVKANAEKQLLEMAKENSSIIPEGISLDKLLGKGLGEALMQECKLGLEAGSIIPGQAAKEGREVNQTEINTMKMSLHQANGQLKLAKMDIQIKQIEIEQSKAAGKTDDAAKLEAELDKMKQELTNQESQRDALSAQIKSLDK